MHQDKLDLLIDTLCSHTFKLSIVELPKETGNYYCESSFGDFGISVTHNFKGIATINTERNFNLVGKRYNVFKPLIEQGGLVCLTISIEKPKTTTEPSLICNTAIFNKVTLSSTRGATCTEYFIELEAFAKLVWGTYKINIIGLCAITKAALIPSSRHKINSLLVEGDTKDYISLKQALDIETTLHTLKTNNSNFFDTGLELYFKEFTDEGQRTENTLVIKQYFQGEIIEQSKTLPIRNTDIHAPLKIKELVLKIHNLRDDIRMLVDNILNKVVNPLNVEEASDMASLKEQINQRHKEVARLYIELHRQTVPLMEQISKDITSRDLKIQEIEKTKTLVKKEIHNYVLFPGNIEGMPALFHKGKHQIENKEGFLTITKEPLKISDTEVYFEKITINLLALDTEQQREETIEHTELFFGDSSGRPGLLLKALITLVSMHQKWCGLEKPKGSFTFYLNDFVDAMFPNMVSTFKEQGRTRAFGRTLKAEEAVEATLNMLSLIEYRRDIQITKKQKDKLKHKNYYDAINGFINKEGHGEDEKGKYFKFSFNRPFMDLLTGENPLYFLINVHAMLGGYNSRMESSLPIAQVALELIFKEVLYNTNKETIITNNGYGWKAITLIQKFGITLGKKEGKEHLYKELIRHLDTLKEIGVLSEWSVQREDKDDKLNNLIEIKPAAF